MAKIILFTTPLIHLNPLNNFNHKFTNNKNKENIVQSKFYKTRKIFILQLISQYIYYYIILNNIMITIQILPQCHILIGYQNEAVLIKLKLEITWATNICVLIIQT